VKNQINFTKLWPSQK